MALKQTATKTTTIEVPALQLQETPPVFVVVIPGRWLLQHTTPFLAATMIRMLGFQRIVKEVNRAKQIARTILDRERALPNAIIFGDRTPENLPFLMAKLPYPIGPSFSLSTDSIGCGRKSSPLRTVSMPVSSTSISPRKRWRSFFLEINENQRRVSLFSAVGFGQGWSGPEGDEAAITASENRIRARRAG